MTNRHSLTRRQMLGGSAALALAATAAGRVATPAFAQQKMVFKCSDVHPTGYPTVAAVESMGKKLEQATNGRK